MIDGFDFEAPKTKIFKALVDRVGGGEKKVLVLTNGAKPNVYLSGRNLPNVHVLPYSDVSTYHLLWSDLVLIEHAALTGATTDDAGPEMEVERPKKKPARTATKAKAASKAASAGKKRVTTPSKKKGK